MARNPENMSRAVGQPPIDAPLGGRPMPELKPARRNHTGRNLAIAGTLAAAVGAAAFGVSQLGKNEGTNPEFTPPAGGIVEPSNSPIPTPFSTESPTITLPPSPEVTPKPTPEATPPPLTINTIVEGDHPAVKPAAIYNSFEAIYKNDPNANYDVIVKNFNDCETGGDAPTAKAKLGVRRDVCFVFVAYEFNKYKETGDIIHYNLAQDIYNYSISKYGLGPSYKEVLDSELAKLN